MKRFRTIVPMNKKASYLEARRLTKDKGGLPSNVLHDDYLMRSNDWEKIGRVYPAWAREVLVYPESGGQFKNGKDVVDSETGWILPASYVPEEATGREKVGLFVDPEEVTEENGKVVVHPKSVVILTPFIQESMEYGVMDESSRIPLDLEPAPIVEPLKPEEEGTIMQPLKTIISGLLESPSEKDARTFHRIEGIGVRPLSRTTEENQDVNTDEHPDSKFGVATVKCEKLIKPLQVGKIELEQLVKAAEAEIEEALLMMRPERLEATRRLLKKLEIKE